MTRARGTMAEKARIKLAAEQIWDHVRRGENIQVPFTRDPKDLTFKAIAELQRTRPTVKLRMYSRYGPVVGLFQGKTGTLSEGFMKQLTDAGVIADAVDKYEEVTALSLVQDQEAFLRKQGIDPVQAEREAQNERMGAAAITVKGDGTKLEPNAEPTLGEVIAKAKAAKEKAETEKVAVSTEPKASSDA